MTLNIILALAGFFILVGVVSTAYLIFRLFRRKK